MPCITFSSALNALPTAIALLSFFAIDRVTRYILKVRLLVPCRPVLLEQFKVIPSVMQCGKMCSELLGSSAT